MIEELAVNNFKSMFRGDIILAGDEQYESSRRVYNGMINRRPQIIAKCADTADVISAVNFGRENKLLVAVRGGGA